MRPLHFLKYQEAVTNNTASYSRRTETAVFTLLHVISR